MKGAKINKLIESFLVILLIIGLCVSVVVLMNAGRKTYSRIIENSSQMENARIALSYFNMRIRQNDVKDSVSFVENAIDGQDSIIIRHTGVEDGMVTYIYYKDGALRENYVMTDIEPDPEGSEIIIGLGGLTIQYEPSNNFYKITVEYMQDGITRKMERIISKKTD